MKFKFTAAAVALALFAVGGSAVCLAGSPSFKKAHRFTQKGEKALQTGDIASARKNFGKALEIEPGFPTAHVGLGHVSMAESKFSGALEHYQAALDEYGKFGAMVEEIQGQRYRSAQSEISSLRDSIGSLASNTTNTQWANMQISKIELAISRLEVIEPPDPGEVGRPPAEYHFYVGNAMFQVGNLDGAIGAWERCRDEKPKFAMVYNNLALAYWKRGRLKEAVAALDQAEELGFPVNPDFRRDLTKAAGQG